MGGVENKKTTTMKQNTHEKTTINVIYTDINNYEIVKESEIPKNLESYLHEYNNYYIIFYYKKTENKKEQWC